MSNSQRSRHTYGLLGKATIKELESIRVGIKRNNIVSSQPPGPLVRNLDDPKSITSLVHETNGYSFSRPIFEREGIQVNNERLVLVDANVYDPPRSRSYSGSKSPQPAHYSRRRSRSRSRSKNRTSLERSKSTDKNVDRRRSPERSSDLRRNPDTRGYEKRRRSVDRRNSNERDCEKTSEKYSYGERRKSITPLRPGEYRPNHPDLKNRSRSWEKSRHSRSRSKGKLSKEQHSRRKSPSPRRKPSSSPHRSPKSRRYSKSPPKYERKRSRSTTPKYSKTPSHYEHYHRRRSRSPRQVGSSSSPRGSRDRKRYSRTPEYERDRRYRPERERRKSRSRSPNRNPYRESSLDFGYFEGIPAPEYWMHPGLMRPGYPAPRFYPPVFYPRGVAPGAPLMFPPRYPMLPPTIRGKLPVYNSRPIPKVDNVQDVEHSEGVTGKGHSVAVEDVKSNEARPVNIEENKSQE